MTRPQLRISQNSICTRDPYEQPAVRGVCGYELQRYIRGRVCILDFKDLHRQLEHRMWLRFRIWR